ncbi:MAG TPA: hypothetical protein VN814_23450 [Caulobacteraceae bacterium]|nr:hypothetical protein [Caulobacteraceae bacterium]
MRPTLGPLRYQQQDSPQTLADGLEEYYAANVGKVVRPRDLPPESAALFRSHDMCHVVFGLNTTLDDEAMADVRTLLSCDVGWRRYARYMTSDPAAKAIFKELGYLKSVWVTIHAMPRICRGAIEAFRVKRQWPWTPPESFHDRPLAELREEFGIRLV